jgi:hypothetical protein
LFLAWLHAGILGSPRPGFSFSTPYLRIYPFSQPVSQRQ